VSYLAVLPLDVVVDINSLEGKIMSISQKSDVDFLDFSAVSKACSDYVEFISSEDFIEDRLSDYKNDIFEAAIEACYGKGI